MIMRSCSKLISLAFILLFSINSMAKPALIPAAPQIAAKGYILLDVYSGKIIAEKNADERLEPASLTKMMTSYIADYELAQGNIAMDDMTTVSENAWAKKLEGSKMFLEVGKKVSVEDLMKGIIISSGNDATIALAEHVAGSSDAFADIMNQHAQLLGMKDSQFKNPHGLPAEGHYTTARDMAILAAAIIKDFPESYHMYSQKSFVYNNIKQSNRNKLLWSEPSVDGLKTGYTKAAGYCLVASSKKDDMRLVAVVMGAKSENARAREAAKLLSFGHRYYKTYKVYSQGQQIKEARVWGGELENVALVAKRDVYVTVPRSQKNDVKAETQIDKYIQAPIKKGQELGVLEVNLLEKNLLTVPLTAKSAVGKGGIFKVLSDKAQLFVKQLIED